MHDARAHALGSGGEAPRQERTQTGNSMVAASAIRSSLVGPGCCGMPAASLAAAQTAAWRLRIAVAAGGCTAAGGATRVAIPLPRKSCSGCGQR